MLGCDWCVGLNVPREDAKSVICNSVADTVSSDKQILTMGNVWHCARGRCARRTGRYCGDALGRDVKASRT